MFLLSLGIRRNEVPEEVGKKVTAIFTRHDASPDSPVVVEVSVEVVIVEPVQSLARFHEWEFPEGARRRNT